MLKQSYEVEVVINGKSAKEYFHKGQVYIEGRTGTGFTVRIRNNSNSKKLFVPTIDGLSVMNGEEGSFKSGGYIVQGNSTITIDGWRTSDEEVATFYFSSPEQSYRKKMKKGDNLGVIGVAVFGEKSSYVTATAIYPTMFPYVQKTQWQMPNPIWTTSVGSGGGGGGHGNFGVSATMCCSASSNVGSNSSQEIGTGWGEIKQSSVTTVNFDSENNPEVVFEIRYNTREQLEKAGINTKKEPLYVTPQAFPGQYCKAPKK